MIRLRLSNPSKLSTFNKCSVDVYLFITAVVQRKNNNLVKTSPSVIACMLLYYINLSSINKWH